jgi:hypothetical protein
MLLNGLGRLSIITEKKKCWLSKTKWAWNRGGNGNVHKDTAAELVPGLLDDAVDDHLFDVEDGEHGGGKDEQDGLSELCTGACAGREGGTREREIVASGP